MSTKINFDYMGAYELNKTGYPIAWANKELEQEYWNTNTVWGEWYEAIALPEHQWSVNQPDTQKELMDQLNIYEILQENDVEYKEVNGRLRFLCPVHEDNNPSCDYWKDIQAFKCWACGAKGSLLELNWRLQDGS